MKRSFKKVAGFGDAIVVESVFLHSLWWIYHLYVSGFRSTIRMRLFFCVRIICVDSYGVKFEVRVT